MQAAVGKGRALPARFGKVAVLMGGTSAEREISLESGGAVLAALQRQGVNAHAIDAGDGVLKMLDGAGYDRVFIALHGRGGEDGVIQGALETIGLPYTGSGVLGSALTMDKCRSKRIWMSAGLPTPDFTELNTETDVDAVCDALGLPLMLKPVREGSSLGASKVTDRGSFDQARQLAAQFDHRVMAERWIEGEEYTASILKGQVLPLIKLQTPRTFYDYTAKYNDENTRYICPCGLDAGQEEDLAELALRAFALLGARGWGRVDLMLDNVGNPWLIEVNAVPGMTSHSLVPMAARVAGIDFDDLVLRILETTMDTVE